jgi:hypothetical protein
MLKIFPHVSRTLASIGCLLCLSTAHSAPIDVVSVTSTGFGENAAAATVDAVRNGVAQVDGETIASSQHVQSTTTSASGEGTHKSRTIDDDIQRTTHGVVKSWRQIATVPTHGGFQATVQVGVVVLRQSEQLRRIKIVVVPSHAPADDVTAALVNDIAANLVESRKFAIIDQQQNEAINQQLAKIRAGAQIEDLVRLTAGVAPDYLAIVSTHSQQTQGDTTRVQGELQIIDYSSRQIKFAEQKGFNFHAGNPFPLQKRIAALSTTLSRDLIQTIYPPLVVGEDNGVLTIAQGSNYFKVGDKCSVKEVDGAVRDPYTKEFLGYKSVDVGTATITYADSRVSQARLDSQEPLDAQRLAAHKYQIWRIEASAADVFKAMNADVGIGDGAKNDKKQDDPDY